MWRDEQANRVEPPTTGREGAQAARSRNMVAGFAVLAGLLLLQLYLVWFKSFNWDEFLHYGHVFAARNGTLDAPFQVLHARILFWVPETAASIVDQMRIARLFMFACTLVTLAAIYGLAQRFTSRENALLAAIAYLGAGYVFTQSFSIRADPMAAASLMSALYLMTSKVKPLASYLAAGALVGLAGMITMKSIFYAPCFAGLAWLAWCENEDKRKILTCFAAGAVAAALSFGAIYLWHTSNLAPMPERFNEVSDFASEGQRWLAPDSRPGLRFVFRQAVLAIPFVAALLLAPVAWQKANCPRSHLLAILGLAAPLLTLLFYRNTFPYFFVFLLAPVAIAGVASWGLIANRYGQRVTLILLVLSPAAMAVIEPRDNIIRQEAVISYLRSEYPTPVGYLSRSDLLPEFNRVIPNIASSAGMEGYYKKGIPLVARSFEKGELAFIVGTTPHILNSLDGRSFKNSFLPEDVAVMHDHYVPQWGPIFREGELIEPIEGRQEVTIPRPGNYILDGNPVILNGSLIEHGETVVLEAGTHSIECMRDCDRKTVLWRGDRLPGPPPVVPPGSFYTTF